jgi:hypothetical protein
MYCICTCLPGAFLSLSIACTADVMLACWKQHYPGLPKPYTTLPEAFEGCRYLHLLPGASWKLQLDIQQMIADCAATMRDMRGDWEAVAAAGAAAVAARAPSLQEATSPAAAAAGAELNAAAAGNGGEVTALAQVAEPTAGGAGAGPTAYTGPASTASDSSSSSVVAAVGLQQDQQELSYLSVQQQQPAVPNMTQLLQLLAYAPQEICSRASVVLVPEVAQSLLFADQGDGSSSALQQQLQKLAGSAAASTYEAQGIQIVSDAAAASQVSDHLMACPILAFGMCCSSSGSSSSGNEAPVLLQVLAPPIVSGEGAALDAAVYVFDVRGQQQQQQQSAALLTLLNILLEDVRVVKLVEDAAHVSEVVSPFVTQPAALGLAFAALMYLVQLNVDDWLLHVCPHLTGHLNRIVSATCELGFQMCVTQLASIVVVPAWLCSVQLEHVRKVA